MSPLLDALIGAAAPTIAIIINHYLAKRDAKAAAHKLDETSAVTSENAIRLEKADAKLDGIHILVNSRLSEALERIVRLEQALHARGIDPPV